MGNLVKETKSYILDYVIDPTLKTQTNQKLTIQEARKRGILNVEKGLYVDLNNKNAAIPIDEAIRLGLIGARVTICEKNFINDADGSITSRDAVDSNIEACTSTLTIDSVFDPKSSRFVSISESLKIGLLDQTNLSYKNYMNGEIMTLNEAYMKGFVKGNQFYENRANSSSPSTNTDTANSSMLDSNELEDEKCFQIKSFLNPLTQTYVNLDQAIQQGLFDKERGLFLNPLDGTPMNLNEALKKGFMQTLNAENTNGNKNILVIDVVNNKTLNPDKTLLYQVNEVEEFKFMIDKERDSFQPRSINIDEQRVEEIIEDEDESEQEETASLGKPPINMRKSLPKTKQTNLQPNILERRIRESVCNSLDIGARETLIIDDVRQSMALDIDGVTHVLKNEFVIDCDSNGDGKIGKANNETSSSISSLSSSPSKNSMTSSTSESSNLKSKMSNHRTVIVVDDQFINYDDKKMTKKKQSEKSKSEDTSNTLKIDVNKMPIDLKTSQFLSNSERALYERVNKNSIFKVSLNLRMRVYFS